MTKTFEVLVTTHQPRYRSKCDRLSLGFPSRTDKGIYQLSIMANEEAGSIVVDVDGYQKSFHPDQFAQVMEQLVSGGYSKSNTEIVNSSYEPVSNVDASDLLPERIVIAQELYARRFSEDEVNEVAEEQAWKETPNQNRPSVSKTLYIRSKTGRDVPFKAQFLVAFEPGSNKVISSSLSPIR